MKFYEDLFEFENYIYLYNNNKPNTILEFYLAVNSCKFLLNNALPF